jgi:hypothetical protein
MKARRGPMWRVRLKEGLGACGLYAKSACANSPVRDVRTLRFACREGDMLGLARVRLTPSFGLLIDLAAVEKDCESLPWVVGCKALR